MPYSAARHRDVAEEIVHPLSIWLLENILLLEIDRTDGVGMEEVLEYDDCTGTLQRNCTLSSESVLSKFRNNVFPPNNQHSLTHEAITSQRTATRFKSCSCHEPHLSNN